MGEKKTTPITIDDVEYQYEDMTEQQRRVVAVLQRERQHTVWAKPGNGKTVIALTAVEDEYPSKCLIVGTPRICELVWRQETLQWSHLKHIHDEMQWLKGGSSGP